MMCTSRPNSSRRRGFTLIETALATVIIGTGVLAIVFAQQTFHRQNDWAMRSAIAMQLGGEIREMMINLPRHDPVTGNSIWGVEDNELGIEDYDDVDDFHEGIFSFDLGNGPISALRTTIPDLPGWSQRIEVRSVDPFDIQETVENGTSEMLRVEVHVEYQGPLDMSPMEITRLAWIQPR